MFKVTASLVICLSLMGCNRNQQAEAPAPVVASAPACNCPQQMAAAVPVVAPVAHRQRHRHHRHSVDEIASYADSISEHSGSSWSPESGSEADDSDGAERAQTEVHTESAAWIDGYGRGHYGSVEAPDDSNPATLTPVDARRRLAPWHAYNADCDRDR